MRIGILTLPLHTNYGGILQAYALQTVLERMGYTVEVIGRQGPLMDLPLWHRFLSIIKRSCQRYLMGKKDIVIDRVKVANKRTELSIDNTRKFIVKYIHVRNLESLKEIKPTDYNAIIVGSDQIWRQTYNQIWKYQNVDDVFLGFAKSWDIKRIAYAASFGIDEIEITNRKDLEKCSKALALFTAVSTREESGVKICSDVLGYKNAKWMPDPTLLLSREDYERLIPNYNNCEDSHQLLSYILDDNEEKSALRKKIAREYNLTINITNKVDYWKVGEEIIPQAPVEDWLRAFENSEYVVTDSFHACVFSILFHKQFTVIANRERGTARLTSLLKRFGLEKRLIFSPSEYRPLPSIDYEEVDKMLKDIRKGAFNFLESSLS